MKEDEYNAEMFGEQIRIFKNCKKPVHVFYSRINCLCFLFQG